MLPPATPPTCDSPRARSTTIESTTTSLQAVLSDANIIITAAPDEEVTDSASVTQEKVPSRPQATMYDLRL
jgi:hypothetical protein